MITEFGHIVSNDVFQYFNRLGLDHFELPDEMSTSRAHVSLLTCVLKQGDQIRQMSSADFFES